MLSRFVAVGAAVLSLLVAIGPVRADPPAPVATPVDLPTLPPDAPVNPYVKAGIDLLGGMVRRQLQNDANRADGRVTYFRRFDLQVRTGPNAYRNVRLHQGTEIDPRGETIRPGDHVSVAGTGAGDGSLDADVVTIVH